MSLTEAVLIAAVVFVLVVIGLTVAVRLGLGKEFQKAVALREESLKVLELTRRNQEESRQYVEGVRKSTAERNEDLRVRAEAVEERTKKSLERAERSHERWEKILSRAEALLDGLEQR